MIQPSKIIFSNRRSVVLKITKDGELIAYAPLNCDQKRIDDFVLLKQKWIAKSLEKVNNVNAKYNIDPLTDGSIVYLLGKSYVVKIGDYKKGGIIGEAFAVPQKYTDNINTYIAKWYKDRAKVYLKERLDAVASKMNESNYTVKITSAKTRWGSCSGKRNINLNYRLLMCPNNVIDYIAVHELSHLEYMNHQKDFYLKVERYCPDYKNVEKWLKNNAGILNIN